MGKNDNMTKFYAKLLKGNERWAEGTEIEISEKDVERVLKSGWCYEDFVDTDKCYYYPCEVIAATYQYVNEKQVGVSANANVLEEPINVPPFSFAIPEDKRKIMPEGYGEY